MADKSETRSDAELGAWFKSQVSLKLAPVTGTQLRTFKVEGSEFPPGDHRRWKSHDGHTYQGKVFELTSEKASVQNEQVLLQVEMSYAPSPFQAGEIAFHICSDEGTKVTLTIDGQELKSAIPVKKWNDFERIAFPVPSRFLSKSTITVLLEAKGQAKKVYIAEPAPAEPAPVPASAQASPPHSTVADSIHGPVALQRGTPQLRFCVGFFLALLVLMLSMLTNICSELGALADEGISRSWMGAPMLIGILGALAAAVVGKLNAGAGSGARHLFAGFHAMAGSRKVVVCSVLGLLLTVSVWWNIEIFCVVSAKAEYTRLLNTYLDRGRNLPPGASADQLLVQALVLVPQRYEAQFLFVERAYQPGFSREERAQFIDGLESNDAFKRTIASYESGYVGSGLLDKKLVGRDPLLWYAGLLPLKDHKGTTEGRQLAVRILAKRTDSEAKLLSTIIESEFDDQAAKQLENLLGLVNLDDGSIKEVHFSLQEAIDHRAQTYFNGDKEKCVGLFESVLKHRAGFKDQSRTTTFGRAPTHLFLFHLMTNYADLIDKNEKPMQPEEEWRSQGRDFVKCDDFRKQFEKRIYGQEQYNVWKAISTWNKHTILDPERMKSLPEHLKKGWRY